MTEGYEGDARHGKGRKAHRHATADDLGLQRGHDDLLLGRRQLLARGRHPLQQTLRCLKLLKPTRLWSNRNVRRHMRNSNKG